MLESEAYVVHKSYMEAIEDFQKPYSTETKKRVDEIRGMYIRILHAMVREHASATERHKY